MTLSSPAHLDHPLLSQLTGMVPDHPACGRLCLVGGAVRDALLGQSPADFDLTAAHDPTPLARAFAGRIGGHWFWLDEPRRQSRVIASGAIWDFAPWRAPTLAEDLAARDFTINAMALDLARPLTVEYLIDPTGGWDDLRLRRLHQAGPGVLFDDPLRILKGLRHVAELDLTITAATLSAMQSAATALPRVAVERLRGEIWRILAAPRAERGLDGLLASGAGEILFGARFPDRFPAAQSALCRVQRYLAATGSHASVARDWLTAPVEQHLDRASLLLWWFALRAIDRQLPLQLAQEWRFSRAAVERLAALGRLRPEMRAELRALPHRSRAVALWAGQFGPDPVDLLLGLGLLAALSPEMVVRELAPLLALLAELDDPSRLPHLVDGTWLAAELGLAGEAIGAAQAALRQAEIRGEVADAEQARGFLRREFGKKD